MGVTGLKNKYHFILILLVFSSFCVKLPLYRFHSSLPEADVKAPVGRSMILAAVLIKLWGISVFNY